jgi:hypothetical protein
MSERERDLRKNSREPKPSKETYNGKNKTVENKKKIDRSYNNHIQGSYPSIKLPLINKTKQKKPHIVGV